MTDETLTGEINSRMMYSEDILTYCIAFGEYLRSLNICTNRLQDYLQNFPKKFFLINEHISVQTGSREYQNISIFILLFSVQESIKNINGNKD